MLMRAVDLMEKWIITTGFVVATLLLFTNVVLRYLFDTGFTWVLEAVQYLFAWVVLIGAAHGVKEGVHLGIDILVERFSKPVRRRLALLALSACLAFVSIVLWLSIDYTLRIREWGDLSLDLQIPQWIPYLAIPVGLSLMLLHFLNVGMQILRGEISSIHKREGTEHLEDIEEIYK
ncbi:MAG: TRAP transporter small permease [Magnetococcales bacterium]|nr:TRAP transporter small permease [Magnetococcales bacterium]